MNEDGYCFPVKGDNWICPDDYHDVDDDESGQCYPNEEGCNSYTIVNGERFDYILLTDRPDGKSDRCAKLGYLCEGEEEGETLPECKEYRKAVNSDDTMVNDIPPDGEGLFCDYPYHPGSCYDRNDNPEEFCVLYPQYTKFCEIIGEICDDSESVNNIDSTDPECTDEDSPCPENYVRNGKYCVKYRLDCNGVYATNYLCNGKERTDEMLGYEKPWHPGYRFCN